MIEELCDGHDYEVIRPGFGGRWSWPFNVMEPGDYFHVEHAQKTPADVRKIATVRMSQEGKYVSVVKDSPLMGGHTLVVCTPPPDQRKAVVKQLVAMEYHSAQQRLDQWYYGVDIGQAAAGLGIEQFDVVKVAGQKIAEPNVKRIVFMLGNWTVGAEMHEDGVSFMRLPDRATPAQWDALYEQWERERPTWKRQLLEQYAREDEARRGTRLSDVMDS